MRIRTMKMYMAVALTLLTLGCSELTGTGGFDIATVSAGGHFINSTSTPTILQCDLSLDGKVIDTHTYATATGECTLVGVANISNGNHSLSFRIVNQTTSPNEYKVFEADVLSASSEPYIKFLDDKTQTLATGQSISLTFGWP